MAVEMIRKLICDVGERHEASSTLSFGLSGQLYEVDLCDRHAKDFDKDMNKWMTAGRRAQQAQRKRRVSTGAVTATAQQEAEYARAWAKLTGRFQVKESGRLSPTVLKAWRDAGAPTGD